VASAADVLTNLDGSSFFGTQPNGDVDGIGASGVFHDGVRHLSPIHQPAIERPALHAVLAPGAPARRAGA
jgi:hypothetical protein